MSGCTMPMLAAKIAVVPPMIPTTASAVGAYSNSGDRRATMKTPAVTIVAAWIKADTGVGPSIASGSQVCRPSWADFPIAPINNRMQAKFSDGTCQPRKLIVVLTAAGAFPNTVQVTGAVFYVGSAVDPNGNFKTVGATQTAPGTWTATLPPSGWIPGRLRS